MEYNNFSLQIIINHNGVYNIIFNNLYIYYSKNIICLKEKFYYPNTFFRFKNQFETINNEYYYIEEIISKYKLGFSDNKEIIFQVKKKSTQLWKFIPTNEDYYSIVNKEGCYIKVIGLKLYCNYIDIKDATKFDLVKIYNELNLTYNDKNIQILNNEPIDVLIKYIDLRDNKLIRKEIHQIDKDYDNEELRYSIRSILSNIPWIRKIFILMPNEKVRYLKDYSSIKDKIIYVKDKDLLGYDSSNDRAFQYRYWKLKNFNISENIIIMDDDYFIGKKLKKSDFFYVDNGKVYPFIVTSQFLKLDKKYISDKFKIYNKKLKLNNIEQNHIVWDYCVYNTYSFIFDLFNISNNKYIFLPKFTHNAIPINIKDINEIYDVIYNSEFKYPTLDSLYRHPNGIQYQIFATSYIFLKYNRKVNNIPSIFIQLNNSIKGNYKNDLFCINKGTFNYTDLAFYKSKLVMEYLFQKPSLYEIIDYSFINKSFNVAFTMDKIINNYEIQLSKTITKKECLNLIIMLILVFISFYLKLFNFKL